MQLSHPDRQAARAELVAEGFTTAHNNPGRPELWAKSKDKRRFAIAREKGAGSETWHIVPYPEPAVCGPAEAQELAKRDGIVLQSGIMPVSAELPASGLTTEETDWLS